MDISRRDVWSGTQSAVCPGFVMLLGIGDFLVSVVLFYGMVWLSCFLNLSGQGYLLGNVTGSLWRERKGEYILNLDTLN